MDQPLGEDGRPARSRAVPAMPPDGDDDPGADERGHRAVLAASGVVPEPPGPPVRGRRRLDGLAGLADAKVEVFALVALVLAPSLFGLPGLLGALVLVAASRFWGARAKAVAVVGALCGALLFVVVVAWLRATQVSEAQSSASRVSTAGHALAEVFASLPAGIGWFAAAWLGFLLAQSLADERSD